MKCSSEPAPDSFPNGKESGLLWWDAGFAAALDIAGTIAKRLSFHVEQGEAAFPELDRTKITDKFIAETAVLLLVGYRTGAAPLNRLLDLAHLIETAARDPRHLAILAESPQAVVGTALAHSVLETLGLHDADFDAAVLSALRDPAVWAIDRPVFRHLELAWLRGLCGAGDDDIATYASASLLAHQLHPAWMRREDGYAATHTIMYLSDFGSRGLPGQISIPVVGLFVEHGIVLLLGSNHWDLLCEIQNAYLCGGRSPRFFQLAAQQLEAARRTHGALPGPSWPMLSGMEPSEGRESIWLLNAYHPTFVFGILCALASTQPERASGPVTDIESDLRTAMAEAQLIALTRRGPWTELMDCLPSIEQHASGRIGESCSQAAAKIMRVIRATTYQCDRPAPGDR
jgi:hypothetical protein